jgi:hypothetical protein
VKYKRQAKVTCPGDVDAAKSAQSLGEQIAKAAERIRYLVQLKFYRDADLYVDPVAGSALAPTNNAFKCVLFCFLQSWLASNTILGFAEQVFHSGRAANRLSCTSVNVPSSVAYAVLAQAMVGQPIDTDRLGKDLQAFLDGCEKIAGVCSDPAQRKALMDSIGQAKQVQYTCAQPCSCSAEEMLQGHSPTIPLVIVSSFSFFHYSCAVTIQALLR